MALAGAGRAEEVDHLGAGDEVELGKGQESLPVERGLEGEVEALQGLRRVQTGGLEGHADAPVLPGLVFLGEQAVDRLKGGDLAALEALHGVIEGLKRAGHLEADQAGADAFEERGHDVAPSSARRRPTAP